MKIQERLDYFSKQSYDYKKQQVFFLLEGIKDKDPVIKELYANLNLLITIPDDLLLEVYTDILNLEQIIIEKDKKSALEKFSFTNQWIKDLHEKEATERRQEDPENNLNQALNTL